jgi:hypothetical protein
MEFRQQHPRQGGRTVLIIKTCIFPKLVCFVWNINCKVFFCPKKRVEIVRPLRHLLTSQTRMKSHKTDPRLGEALMSEIEKIRSSILDPRGLKAIL